MEKLFEALSGTQVLILCGAVVYAVYLLAQSGIDAARRAAEANARAKVDCQRLEVARQLADAGHVPDAVEQLLRTADPAADPLAGKSEHDLAGVLAARLAAAGADADTVEEVVGLYWKADPPLKLAVTRTVAELQDEQAEKEYEAETIVAAAAGLLKSAPPRAAEVVAAR
jgi:hypothetical protein